MFVLASRSPQRLQLLSLLVPRSQIRVLPPTTSVEAGFDGLTDLPGIQTRLLSIAATKCDNTLRQLGPFCTDTVAIAADTIVIAGDNNALAADNREVADSAADKSGLEVLGQPADAATVRRWFTDHYAGRTHRVLTGLRVVTATQQREAIATTHVTFRRDVAARLEWYLNTGEPFGKAGGYAVQGLGSTFIERVEGSLTNVIGLPLETLLRVFDELAIPTGGAPPA